MKSSILREVSFGEGVVVALMLSAFGSVAYFLANILFGATLGLIPILASVGGLYALYLVSRSRPTSGKLVAVTAILIVCIALVLLPISILAIGSILVFGMWLIRACLFRFGVIDSLSDLLLIGFGVAVSAFAAFHTHSLFICLWTFFIVQAFHVYLPGPRRGKNMQPDYARKFDRAFKNAEDALRQHYGAFN